VTNIFVKGQNGYDFQGKCWPGLSVWVDFFNSFARSFWHSLFKFDHFKNTSPLYGLWIDMNEPSVFDWHDMTLPPTAVHVLANGMSVSHLNVHNAYGLMMARASWEAIAKRDNYTQRPFVLTRSVFTGSQQYGACWTGDN